MRTRRMVGEGGATAVEFALVLPLVLALVGTLLTAGLGMGIRGLLHRGVEVGARSAAVIADVGARGPERYLSDAEIADAVRAGTVLLGGTDVEVTWPDDHRGEGAQFIVTATYAWSNPAARLVAPIAGATAADGESFTFSAQTTRRRE